MDQFWIVVDNLDEALALDTKNQANLIEIAEQFGFALIFASPAPLTTARYCVPIHQVNGQNKLWIDTAREFESFERNAGQWVDQEDELKALIQTMKKQGLALEQEVVWLSVI